MMKQQESSPFTTAGKSFEKNYILHGFTICVYHEGMITKEYEITKRVRDHFSRICNDKQSDQQSKVLEHNKTVYFIQEKAVFPQSAYCFKRPW